MNIEDMAAPNPPVQGEVKELVLPAVFANLQQLEESNRAMSASIISIVNLLHKKGVVDVEEYHAERTRMLNWLDSAFQRQMQLVSPDLEKQAEWLQLHPHAILFSGATIPDILKAEREGK